MEPTSPNSGSRLGGPVARRPVADNESGNPPIGQAQAAAAALALESTRKSRMHSDERRRQLLRVAIESFGRNGFSGTKTKDIAHAAGVSEAILFRHFATKEDLYHAILDSKEDKKGTQRMLAMLKECADRRDDRGYFEVLATHILASFKEDPAFQRLVFYALLEGHLMAGLFFERLGSVAKEMVTKYITLRQKDGAFQKHDPRTAVHFAFGTFVHFAIGLYVFNLPRPRGNEQAAMNELIDMVVDGLSGKAAGEGNKKRKGSYAESI
jgi:TetR/AcrR family transcriptional regulator